MKWLPYHRFEISSPLKRQDARAAMAAHVEPARWFRLGWPNSANDNRFQGEVTSDGFRVTRVMGYRNSFMPLVSGEIHAAGALSRVVVTMRPTIVVMIFCGFWLAIMISILISAQPTAIVGVSMIALLYVMVMGGFWFEATKQEHALRQIFKAM